MSVKISLRPVRRLAAAAALLACAGVGAAPPKPWPVPPNEKARPVEAPHYGDALFHFFQDRYFTSITTLMASQHFGRVAAHGDEAEILRGGMLLSYGLHQEAGEIFAQLIEKGATPAVRDRAWFYLAKIRYQRGFLAEAEDAMARIEKNLPAALEEDRLLLQSNLLMARGDYAGAAALLEGVATDSPIGQYARFNLGVALVKSGEEERGVKLLDGLGMAPAADEEMRSLRDKANVALGFSALQSGKPDVARHSLQRVRLESLHANKALLGFGWAAAEMKEPKLALVPWIELASRDASDAAVLEARIAVPYAYAELGAFGEATEQYNAAIAAYDSEGGKLDESIAAIRAGKLLDGLIERNPGEEMGWFWNIRELPEMPYASHLTQVLAGHEFQEAFKNWRDLRFLAKNLQDWEDSLGVFGDMLDNRRQAYAQRLPQVQAGARAVDLSALRQRRDAVSGEVERALREQDAPALADAKDRELLEMIKGVQQGLQSLGNDADAERARQRARLASGALTWRLAQEYPARAWDAQKNMKIIDAELAQAREREAAVAKAQIEEPARHEAFARRIAELSQRIKALIPRVAALSRDQQQEVQELAVAELTRQKERLAVYSQQARFAVAQMYDRAASESPRKEDDASKQ
ncbi:tetratricopeptide repeat protein [uncultured Piscinibacter sp.]|uniref:tetratricopeptide repeat protein n=1 Tax=uncultured Piscinibacter sp. TaxID=1131835 RepID=UPI0026393733|nr:tetratricopeptide repeat protein [uncultured Piscinibacter sp.]